MTTAHHIPFPTPPPCLVCIWKDEEEVEGETILLGKELQIKRSNKKRILRKQDWDGDNDFRKCVLRSQYKTYLEALKKYNKKEEIKEDIKETELNKLKGQYDNRTFTYYRRKEHYERLKKARDKNFKKKWTAILEPYYKRCIFVTPQYNV